MAMSKFFTETRARLAAALLLLAGMLCLSQATGASWLPLGTNCSLGGLTQPYCPPVDLIFVNNTGWQNNTLSTASSLIAVSRASSETCSDLSGNWYQVGNNLPCITNQGLGAWESRTNYTIYNTAINTTNWTASTVTLTPGQADPSGGTGATTLTEGTSSGIQRVISTDNTTFTSGDYYTQSVFIRPGTGTYVQLTFPSAQFGTSQYATFNVQTCSVVTGSTTGGVAYTQSYANGWCRLVFTAEATSTGVGQAGDVVLTTGQNSRTPTYVGTGLTQTIWAPQTELNPGSVGLATPPIITAGSAVTRAVDAVTLLNPPTFGPAYTLYESLTPLCPNVYTNNQWAASIDDGSANNYLGFYRVNSSGDSAWLAKGGGSTVGAVTNSLLMAQGSLSKLASSFSPSVMSTAINGTVVSGTPTGAPSGLNAVHIGTVAGISTTQFNGYIARTAIYPSQVLSSGQLQTITSGSGSYLLKRDIDPAGNDNSPAFLERAA
jgi:hypothetical protein